MEKIMDYDLQIRPIVSGDEALIDEFFSVMGGESRAFFNRHDGNHQTALAYCRNPGDAVKYFMAEEDGRMIGLVFLWDLNTSIPWLGIAVREDFKGKHVGRKLISYAQKYVRDLGKGGIQLTTYVANLRGQVLYETMGFKKLGCCGCGDELYYLFRYTDT